MKKIFLFIALFTVLIVSGAYAVDGDQITVDGFRVDSDGDLIMGTDKTITLGGVSKASWGSVVSPWEDDGTTTTLTSAPTKFILTHATGDIKTTQVTTDDVVGTTNAQNIDLSTNNSFKFVENSDTTTIGHDGDDTLISASDGSIELYPQADATEGTVDFLTGGDVNDFMYVKTTSNVPIIATSGSCNLGIAPDGGTVAVTGIVTVSGAQTLTGATTMTSGIIGDDTFDVVVDDQFRFASNDEESTIEAYGYEAKDGVLQLTADEGDDAGDKIQLVSDQATNSLFITSDTGVKDTHATIFTLAKTGAITTTGDITAVNDSATTDAVQDIVTLTSSSTGTAAAGLGAGLTFNVEDAGGIEQQGSIDVALTTATNGAEDADLIFSVNTAGTIAEVGRFVAASSATTADSFKITSNTTETNAVTDALVLYQVTGTAAANNGIGISFQPEDAGGAEEQASIDVVLTTETNAAEDAAIVFNQQTAGAIAETLRLQGASSATAGDTLEFTSNTTETDAVLDIVKLKIATGTAANGSGIGISFEPEDATGSEQHASIDVVQTTAARATNDTDFVFSQDVNGTMEERVRFDADDDTILLTGTLPKITIGDAGEEDTTIAFDGNAQDFYIALDDTDDDLKIGVGTTVDTTPAITILSDTQVVEFESTVTFAGGQTKHVIYLPTDVKLDGTVPPGTTAIGTSGQAQFSTLGFDSNPNATGDDWVFINWIVPAGYVADSAALDVYWSHSDAEDAADEITIDGTVNAVAAGEALDAAGTGMAAVASVIADASASAGALIKTSLDIEVEDIAVGDLVCIGFFVDESASLMAASGTADVHYFDIVYESTE